MLYQSGKLKKPYKVHGRLDTGFRVGIDTISVLWSLDPSSSIHVRNIIISLEYSWSVVTSLLQVVGWVVLGAHQK